MVSQKSWYGTIWKLNKFDVFAIKKKINLTYLFLFYMFQDIQQLLIWSKLA